MGEAAMLPTFQIRKLPGCSHLWEVVLSLKTGHLETWVGFGSETEARNWVDKKLMHIASQASRRLGTRRVPPESPPFAFGRQ